MMRLRVHPGDQRPTTSLAAVVLEFLSIRKSFLESLGEDLTQDACISDSLAEKMWNEDLKERFLQDMHDHPEDDERTTKRRRTEIHSRFKVWVRDFFGAKKTVETILQRGLEPEAMRYVQTCCWHP